MYCTAYNLSVVFLYLDLQSWCVHCIKLHLHIDHTYRIKGTLITQCGKKVAHTARKLCVLSHWRVLMRPYSAIRILFRMTFPVNMIHHYWVVQWSWFARVNALCNLSRKKSWEAAVSLLSRRCFTLCITTDPFHLDFRARAMAWHVKSAGSRGGTRQLGCWPST